MRSSNNIRSVVLSVISHSIGFLAAILAAWVTIDFTTGGDTSNPRTVDFVFEAIAAGIVISIFQWLVLRQTGLGLPRFILLGTAGLAIGWPIGEVILQPLLGWTVGFVVMGLSIGLGQWLFVRSRFEGVRFWPLVSAIAWGLAAVPVDLGMSDDFVLIIMTAVLYGFVMGIYTYRVIEKQSSV